MTAPNSDAPRVGLEGEVELRPLGVTDLPAMVAVHLASFPKAGLTRLGAESVFLYYETMLTGNYMRDIVGAFLGERLVGFYTAGHLFAVPSDFVRKHRNRLVLRLAIRPWLLLDPFFMDRIKVGFRLLRWRPSQPIAGTPSQPRPYGVLSLAVDPTCQGRGIGRKLMEDTEHRARERGFAAMSLTVHPDNTRAASLYERLGWTRLLKDGQWVGSMQKAL
jgi:ribosomal protein S18 acetylase RimI-like enzyme